MRFKPGDSAKVINSIDGASVGLIVQIVSYAGEHSKYGPIWRCQSKGTIVTEFGGIGNEADFADEWLEPIVPPDEIKTTEKEKELINE